MKRIRIFLSNLLGRIRYNLARIRKWCLDECVLTSRHWQWAAFGMLIIIGMFMLGMGIDFIGELHPGIYLGALVFMVGLPLLAGLGVRLGLRILTLLPRRFNWIYFGAVFFVFSFFHLPTKAQVIMSLFLVCSGAFLGAGIYNLLGGRWVNLSKNKRILTLGFLLIGTGLFAFGWVHLLYPGKGQEDMKAWSMEVKHLPEHLNGVDPALPGTYQVDSLTYGWGRDRRRKEFGEDADLISRVVNGSHFLDGWEKFSGKLRTNYWKMGPDSLALNGRVWYPEGEGPFPLVLMVHGNHHDRDFSDPGYGYLGRHFASHGIISVSVDENFLNGAWYDFNKGLKTENDCRGWLLLKHLVLWRDWNGTDTAFFSGKVDLERVVLIGHSRGGEAVSIASFFNGLPYYPDNSKEAFDFNFGIKGVAAIAPVDGQYWPGGLATPVQDVNYFTIQGSMDADLRSYDGLRQMRRVKFTDSTYHFASGVYVHGANHGQFNQSWGLFDAGYPSNLFLNRQAIIPVEQQEKVALVYLTAFVKESLEPGCGYLPLFQDYRCARQWLPELVYLNQFHESSATIFCEYEEDLDLTTGTQGVEIISAQDLSLWKEGRIPKKWGNQGNNGVFLGWNNEKDTVPGRYRIVLDSTFIREISDFSHLSFLAADAQTGAGERKEVEPEQNGASESAEGGEQSQNPNRSAGGGELTHSTKAKRKGNGQKSEKEDKKDRKAKKDEDEDEDEEAEPMDFSIVLTDWNKVEYRVGIADYQRLQPPIKPEVFKSRLFWEDPESEVILQYVSIPLEGFLSETGAHVGPSDIRSICFEFDLGEKGSVILDQIGFSK